MKVAVAWVDALLSRWGRWAIHCESGAIGFASGCALGGAGGGGYDSAIPHGVLDEDMEAIDGAVRRLPKMMRLAVVEVYQHSHGKSDRQKAAALGIHVNTLTKYICDAQRKIAFDISKPCAHNPPQSVIGGTIPDRL